MGNRRNKRGLVRGAFLMFSKPGRPAHNLPDEQLLRVDIRPLHRRGLLAPGSFTTLRGPVRCLAEERAVVLETPGSWTRVAVVTTPCTFGGMRPWFACPQCLARAAVLYLVGEWGCRACHPVSYASQRESAIDRARRRQNKLAARLPELRPRGMHLDTFARLRLQQIEAEQRYQDAFAARVNVLLGPWGQ